MYLVPMCSPTLDQRPVVHSRIDFCPSPVYSSSSTLLYPAAFSSSRLQSQLHQLSNSLHALPDCRLLAQGNLPIQSAWADLSFSSATPCVGKKLTYIVVEKKICIQDSDKVLVYSIKVKRHIQYDSVILLWLM